jgi:hypothetical protein
MVFRIPSKILPGFCLKTSLLLLFPYPKFVISHDPLNLILPDVKKQPWSLAEFLPRFGEMHGPHLHLRSVRWDNKKSSRLLTESQWSLITYLFASVSSAIMKVEALYSFETSVNLYQTTRHYIPEHLLFVVFVVIGWKLTVALCKQRSNQSKF